MDKFFRFIEQHAKSVLLSILIITVFFIAALTKIQVNASFTAFMPWGEYTDYYEGGITGQIADLGTAKASRNASQAIKAGEVPAVLETPDTSIPVADIPYEEVLDVQTLDKIVPQEEDDYPRNTNFLLLVEADDLFSAKKLNLVDYVVSSLENTRELSKSSSILDFVTLEKKGTRIVTVPMSPKSGEYWTEEEAATLKQRIENDPVAKYYLVGGSGNSMLFSFDISSVGAEKLDEINTMLDLLRENGIEVYTSGGAVITNKIMEYLTRDLFRLISLSLLVILVVFYLSFRSKRSVMIPASLSVIALIWTLGTMSLVGISLNILNIVTPCMVLTLGSAYSIHVLNEYYAKHRQDPGISAAVSTSGVLKTVTYACLTTVFGFLSLCVSQTDGLKEFGISVSFGIAYCAILACIYLPAILTLTSTPKQKQLKNYETGLMARLVSAISRYIIGYWMVPIAVLLIICGAFFVIKDRIPVNSNYMSYFPESDEFGIESRHFAIEMGGATPYEIRIEAPKGSEKFFLQSENLKKVRDYELAILECPDILQSLSFSSYIAHANKIMTGEASIPENNGLMNMLSRLVILLNSQTGGTLSSIISEDGNAVSLTVQHWDSREKDLMTADSITRSYSAIVDNLDLLPEGTSVSVSGDALPNIKFSNRIIADQNRSTLLSLVIVLLFAWVTSKSFKQGFLTVLPVLCGIMINYIFMFAMGIPFDIITVCFSSIAIGCGVDDAIHFMLRLNSKKKTGYDTKTYKQMLGEVIEETGRPIILTTVSIVAGMLMLSFASYTPIRYFGLLMSVTLSGCMVSTLVFLPPVAILIENTGYRLKTILSSKNRSHR